MDTTCYGKAAGTFQMYMADPLHDGSFRDYFFGAGAGGRCCTDCSQAWRGVSNTVVYSILDKIINLFRSIPFIILLATLIPLTRAVVGTAIGTKGAILPLVFGTVPFFSRQVETALSEVDAGLVEAAAAMGTSPAGIIFRVYLKESIPSLVRVTTITLISLIGLTAMAGAIGGGGLGDFAIRYGHQRNQIDVTLVTVVILIFIVMVL